MVRACLKLGKKLVEPAHENDINIDTIVKGRAVWRLTFS